MFKVINIDTGETHPDLFETGKLASELAKRLEGRWQPRPLPKNEVWKEREKKKQESNPLPEWFPTVLKHYAYHSIDNPEKVAFTPSESYGIQDKQVQMCPGAYLTKYFVEKEEDEISLCEGQVESLVLNFKAHFKLFKYKIATTEKDITRIYSTGPNSCIGKPADYFKTNPIHPAVVYANSDLAIAYLGTTYKPKARSVIWPEKKIYSRVYGDPLLVTLLKEDGYQKGDPFGAKIKKIDFQQGYVFPYIDKMKKGPAAAVVAEDGRNLIVKDYANGECYELGKIYQHRQTGVGYKPIKCQFCEITELPPYLKAIAQAAPKTHLIFCKNCAERHTGYCRRCADNNNYVERIVFDELVKIKIKGKIQNWCKPCADKAKTCEKCKSNYIGSEHEVFVKESGEELTKQKWCSKCTKARTTQCGECGLRKDQRGITVNYGPFNTRLVCVDCASKKAWMCYECNHFYASKIHPAYASIDEKSYCEKCVTKCQLCGEVWEKSIELNNNRCEACQPHRTLF